MKGFAFCHFISLGIGQEVKEYPQLLLEGGSELPALPPWICH